MKIIWIIIWTEISEIKRIPAPDSIEIDLFVLPFRGCFRVEAKLFDLILHSPWEFI